MDFHVTKITTMHTIESTLNNACQLFSQLCLSAGHRRQINNLWATFTMLDKGLKQLSPNHDKSTPTEAERIYHQALDRHKQTCMHAFSHLRINTLIRYLEAVYHYLTLLGLGRIHVAIKALPTPQHDEIDNLISDALALNHQLECQERNITHPLSPIPAVLQPLNTTLCQLHHLITRLDSKSHITPRLPISPLHPILTTTQPPQSLCKLN